MVAGLGEVKLSRNRTAKVRFFLAILLLLFFVSLLKKKPDKTTFR